MSAGQAQRGFTLVELAIVMTVIGLLVGGVLQGQQMIQNARVVTTVSQMKSYQAAVISFRDMYQALPGDMPNASSRLVGCNANCNPVAGFAGDGIVGNPGWGNTWGTQGFATAAPPAAHIDETWLFWQHLARANLIDLPSDGINAPTNYAFNVTHPAAKIGGGFAAGYSDGNNLVPGNDGRNCRRRRPRGTCLDLDVAHVLALLRSPAIPPSMTAADSQELTPGVAMRLDAKIDDGEPDTGTVIAFGNAAGCFSILRRRTQNVEYDENTTTSDCGLFFIIQQ